MICVMKKLLFLLVCGLMAGCLFAQPLEKLPEDPRVLKGSLANGLSYYLVKNQAQPGRADFYLVEKSGTALEQSGQAGMTAFLAQMSMRGTRNFPGLTLVDYINDLGLSLERDFEVRTALEETVYRLSNVPVNWSAAVMDSTLLVLYNWSCSVNLDEEDVLASKTYFHNNQASRNTADHRMNRRLRAQLLEGTCYENAFCSNLLNQVDAFTSKELRQYYYQWSRPDLQAVIIVGDFDPAQVEMKIKTLFQTMPKAPQVEERAYARTQLPGCLQVLSASDPQATEARMAFHFRTQPIPEQLRTTSVYFLQNYLDGVTRFLLNERMEMSKQASALPIWDTQISEGRFLGTQNQSSLQLGFATLPDSLDEAVVWTARLLEEVRRNGFSQEEFNRAKGRYFSDLDAAYQYRDKTPNRNLADRCINHFLAGTTLASVEMHHALLHKADSLLSLDAYNMYVSALLRSPEDLTVTFTGPAPDSLCPSQAWVDRALELVAEYNTQMQVHTPVASTTLPALAACEILPTIILETSEPMSGATLLTLSNGVNVLLKSTAAEPGTFQFSAISKGGLSLLQQTNPLQRDYMTDIANLSALGGMSAADLAAYNRAAGIELSKDVSYALSGLYGKAPVAKMDDFLHQVHLQFSAIQPDQAAFDYFVQLSMARTQLAANSPLRQVEDSVAVRLYNPSRYTSLSNPADLATMNYEGSVEFLKKLYANAASYTFVFVGDFDPQNIDFRNQLCRYIGTLPANANRRENWQVLPYYLNKSVRQVVLPIQSETTTAYYRMTLMGECPYGLEEKVTGHVVSGILMNVLKEELFRQGIPSRVEAEFRKYPEEFLLVNLAFETESYDPAVYEGLRNTLNRLANEGIDAVRLASLKKSVKADFDFRQETTCEFWMDLLENRFVYGKDFYTRYLAQLNQISLEQVNQALADFVKEGGRLELVMYGDSNHSN